MIRNWRLSEELSGSDKLFTKFIDFKIALLVRVIEDFPEDSGKVLSMVQQLERYLEVSLSPLRKNPEGI